MMASGRTRTTASGAISGSGFAMANTIGLGAMRLTISSLTTPAWESPTKTSAPSRASLKVRALVSRANSAL